MDESKFDEILAKCDNLLIKLDDNSFNGALTDFESGVYAALKWIVLTECDDECRPDVR